MVTQNIFTLQSTQHWIANCKNKGRWYSEHCLHRPFHAVTHTNPGNQHSIRHGRNNTPTARKWTAKECCWRHEELDKRWFDGTSRVRGTSSSVSWEYSRGKKVWGVMAWIWPKRGFFWTIAPYPHSSYQALLEPTDDQMSTHKGQLSSEAATPMLSDILTTEEVTAEIIR